MSETLIGITTTAIAGYNRPFMSEVYTYSDRARIPAGTEVEVRELRNGKYIVKAAGFWSPRMTWAQVIARVIPA